MAPRACAKRTRADRSCAAALPRFQVELLESRVLLFSGQLAAPFQLVSLGVISPAAVISYSAPVTPVFGQGALVFPSQGQEAGDVGTSLLAPVHLAILTAPEGTDTAFVVHRLAQVDSYPPAFLSSVASSEAASQSAGAAPLFVVQHVDDASFGSSNGGGNSAVAFDGPTTPAFVAQQSGIGSTGPGMFIASPPGGGDITSGSGIPVGFHEAFAGTLDAAHPWFQVPFSVLTSSESIGLMLRATGDSSQMPVLGTIRLLGPDGTPLAEASPDWSPGDPPPPVVNVSMHGMPVGGRLVVQIMPAESSTTSETSAPAAAAPSSSNWSVPFVLYVQRAG